MKDLIKDIYSLFTEGHEVDEKKCTEMGLRIAQQVSSRLKEEERGGKLRLSGIGQPTCKQWYEVNGYTPEKLDAKTKIKFLMGDIIEELLLFLVAEAGYDVSNEQAEVEVNGVLGHIDATIDGHLVDVKSASPYGFQKFKEGTVVNDDPFGYVHQLSSYHHALGLQGPAYWLAMDKVSGELCLSELDDLEMVHDIEDHVQVVKDQTDHDSCPEKLSPVADGKSGNMKLRTECSYCGHKWNCRPDMRMFLYSNGPRWLTHVEKEPKVAEVLRDGTIKPYEEPSD